MKKTLLGIFFLASVLLAITACDTALTVGSRTIGIRSGEFVYSEGHLRATYAFPLEQVWSACEKVVADMKATDVERIKKISEGSLKGMIQDEKVSIQVTYLDKEDTLVAVMVGTAGNTLASQLIHDRIIAVLRSR